uniref:Uncharacterized protein n=1 Tax=Arundo donax TaxID=35708 RepID=A0A0A8Y0H3_ARUDO
MAETSFAYVLHSNNILKKKKRHRCKIKEVLS